jgi:hypothetical protein
MTGSQPQSQPSPWWWRYFLRTSNMVAKRCELGQLDLEQRDEIIHVAESLLGSVAVAEYNEQRCLPVIPLIVDVVDDEGRL